MQVKKTELIAGTTFRATFVSTGTTVTGNISTLLDRSGTLVGSVTATDSGGGYWFAVHNVQTPGWYVNKWFAVIAGNTYIPMPQLIHAIELEVD